MSTRRRRGLDRDLTLTPAPPAKAGNSSVPGGQSVPVVAGCSSASPRLQSSCASDSGLMDYGYQHSNRLLGGSRKGSTTRHVPEVGFAVCWAQSYSFGLFAECYQCPPKNPATGLWG